MLDERWSADVEEIGDALRKLLSAECTPAEVRKAEAAADEMPARGLLRWPRTLHRPTRRVRHRQLRRSRALDAATGSLAAVALAWGLAGAAEVSVKERVGAVDAKGATAAEAVEGATRRSAWNASRR